MPRSNELVKKRTKEKGLMTGTMEKDKHQGTVINDPMAIYKEVSDWKSKCGRLLDRLMCIRGCGTLKDAKEQANKAIKEFEENK